MDSETDTDTHSLCDSEISRDCYKSPESSDCEGYATPLASSLTDVSNAIHQNITIDVPEDGIASIDSGERTPVSTPRAISPPIVKQIIYLQKPRILVMTQREILDESSEEEFYDVDDVQIRDVAQQLWNGVADANADEEVEKCDVTNSHHNERPDTPTVSEEDSEVVLEIEDVIAEEDRLTPVQIQEMVKETVVSEADEMKVEKVEEVVMQVTEAMITETIEKVEKKAQVEKIKSHSQTVKEENILENVANGNNSDKIAQETTMEFVEVSTLAAAPLETEENFDSIESLPLHNGFVENSEKLDIILSNLTKNDTPIVSMEISDNTFDNCENNTANNVITECAHNSKVEEEVENLDVVVENVEDYSKNSEALIFQISDEEIKKNCIASEEVVIPTNDSQGAPVQESVVFEIRNIIDTQQEPSVSVNEENEENVNTESIVGSIPIDDSNNVAPDETCIRDTTSPEEAQSKHVTDRPTELYEQMPETFCEITVAQTPITSEVPVTASDELEETESLEEPQVAFNTETIENEPMPTLVKSDEVKTSSPTTADDDITSECSAHQVKVDFDGYSSGKEESLSSSTSSESFEFAEPVLNNNVHDEKTQALRNSIIERYPSNETDEDELDSVGGNEFDDDLLAVKQISAEVEQLVAAINAFGRDEEQQMSAYLVGKNMAAEKKRKSVMDNSSVVTSSCHDQTVQTENDFILVERHLSVTMESLQVEIDKLQSDLEKVKSGEKELLQINSQLKQELDESQQTIDGIEVEAEQQYTELTSEIDELCEIVLKKDQELAALKERVANLSVSEGNLKDDVDSQRIISQRQKEIIESLREELDAITKKLGDVTKLRDKAIEEATVYKMKNMERDRFLQREAQMSMEIEDLQRELNKQKLILNQTSMAKLADTFDRKVLHLENELRERDMLICKQNQIINSHRKSPTGSVITHRKMQPRASVLAAAGNLPSAGSSSESFQNGLDVEAKDALLTFILSDRHNQLANIYNIGRILDLSPQEERAVERHLTKDRFT